MSAKGTWNLTMKTPMGDQKSVLTIEDEVAVTGALSGQGDSIPLKDGSASGDKLTFKADVKKPMALTIDFDLSVAGDSISGTAKPGMFPAMPVQGERAA